jgi:hypothetical protein
LDCFYCLSLWVAVPFSYWLGTTWPKRAVLWLALSGGAILLERITGEGVLTKPPVAVWEEIPHEAKR